TVATAGIDIERQLGRCWRTIERCDGIIADLLDFAGGRELHAAAMRLDGWLADILDQIKLPPTVALDRRLDAPQAVVPIDSERLRCAIVNLIENAVEAIADKPDLVDHRITVSSAAGPRAEVVIADTGAGMSAEVLSHVFEPLFSTRAFGTGLGLPTVKRILEQHGGEIAIDSAPGDGTRVILQLPLVQTKTSSQAA
ncbi:MAG TPA: HAMP domain-containing sensor histidine kinase, partial [Stellaceae bacterium]